MAASAPLLDRPGWLEDFNSMLISASVHFSLLIILGLLTVAGSGGANRDSIVMTLNGSGGTPGIGDDDFIPDGTQLEDPTQLDSSVDLVAAMGPPTAVDSTAALASEFSIPDAAAALSAADISGAGGTSPQGSADGTKAEPFGILGGIGKGLGGSGDGGSKGSAEFFGIGGYGQSFVYVVDASDSMNDHNKFERARYELLHSIEQLSSEQRFFVIFYNEGAYPMDADGPLRATPENIARITEWIRAVEPIGGTNPRPALVQALTFRPDAIYFLSDGQFDPMLLQEMRLRNRTNTRIDVKMVPIHTIAFFDRMAEGLMRTIARNSGGEYKFVN